MRCPACGETCDAFEFDFLEPTRACPSCGAPLAPASFDQAASETCESLDRLEREHTLLVKAAQAEYARKRAADS